MEIDVYIRCIGCGAVFKPVLNELGVMRAEECSILDIFVHFDRYEDDLIKGLCDGCKQLNSREFGRPYGVVTGSALYGECLY